MQTPKQVGVADTLARFTEYYNTHCRLDAPKALACAQCGDEIQQVRAYMALHDEQFGAACAGPGRAWRMAIPFCPNCEEVPSRYGCIHMTADELNLPSVVAASRPFGPGISAEQSDEYPRPPRHNCPNRAGFSRSSGQSRRRGTSSAQKPRPRGLLPRRRGGRAACA